MTRTDTPINETDGLDTVVEALSVHWTRPSLSKLDELRDLTGMNSDLLKWVEAQGDAACRDKKAALFQSVEDAGHVTLSRELFDAVTRVEADRLDAAFSLGRRVGGSR